MTLAPTTSADPPADPATTTPPRVRSSARRTATVDLLRPEGIGGDLHVEATARDLLTHRDGRIVVAAAATLHARVDADRRLRWLRTVPQRDGLASLAGRLAGTGFRSAARAALGPDAASGTPLHLLLDDLPVTVMVAGYALLVAGAATAHPRPDACAGWRRDGPAMAAVAAGRREVAIGPGAPRLEAPDDPLSWHVALPLPAGAMRRRRRLDVVDGGDGSLRLDAMFRDTYATAPGEEFVLHEYSVVCDVDAATMEVLAARAHPQVLPHHGCSDAAITASAVVGARLRLLRNRVDQSLFGPASCTHLSDLLRSLADAEPLAALLR